MKIAIAGGHSKLAPGASKYINEYTEDRKVKDALIKELQARGHSVVDCSNEKSPSAKELAQECSLANASGADLFLAIHFNAYSVTSGTRGTECYYYKGNTKGKEYATAMSKNVANVLGLPNRGAKANTTYYVLRNTTMRALLIEVCFVDALGDANAYKEVGPEKVAAAIADALVGGGTEVKAASTTTTKTTSSSSNGYLVKITASVLNVRKGAGTNYKVVTTVKKNQVYTIVEEKNGWGKLKSGAGWISLAYTQKV